MKRASNAAKDWRGPFADLRWKKEKVEAKLQQVLGQHERADQEEGETSTPAGCAERQKRPAQLERLAHHAARLEAF